MSRLLFVVFSALALSGCIAHEKLGDRAAALEDWKTAYREYRLALSSDPSVPGLKGKYDGARTEAIRTAVRRAGTCSTAADWSCALAEAEFVLTLDPEQKEALEIRTAAGKALALERIQSAKQEAAARRFPRAFEALGKATALSTDAEVQEASRAAQAEILTLAEVEVERLRGLKQYGEAIPLQEQLVQRDSTRLATLDALKKEQAEYLEAEYERFAGQGDEALDAKEWANAERSYHAALSIHPGGRAQPASLYASRVLRGEQALVGKNYGAAAAAFREALATGWERDAYARERLDQVEVRTYVVRIRSVLATPTRPGGAPWTGQRSKAFDKLLQAGANYFLPVVGGAVMGAVLARADEVPPENRPTLTVEVELPSGRHVTTGSHNAIYAVLEAQFAIACNAFDDRSVNITVRHVGQQPGDLGVIALTTKELIAKKEHLLSDHAISGLQLVVEPSTEMVDGMFAGLVPVNDGSNQASHYSAQTPSAIGYRLTGVQAQVAAGDYAAELGDGSPDPVVEIEQHGQVVYRSPVAKDQPRAQWNPNGVYLFVDPYESLSLRVWDKDLSEDDLALSATVPARSLTTGVVQVRTPRGSFVHLEVAPWPPPSNRPQVAEERGRDFGRLVRAALSTGTPGSNNQPHLAGGIRDHVRPEDHSPVR